MSSTDSSTGDHAYFQAIEECFIRLRGAPLLLSPADWQLAKGWHRQGIPLDLVLETLEGVFVSRLARGAKGKVQGLRYCASAVEKAWLERGEHLATGKRESARPIDVPQKLEQLAARLSHFSAVPGPLIDRLAELEGTPEEVEAALASLDLDMLERVSADLDDASAAAIRESLDQSLSNLESRLEASEVDRFRQRLYREAVRRHLNLPVISLFATGVDQD